MACILVVEDDRAIALGLRLNLRKEGHEVRLCADGEQGLLEALKPDVDLVVLDVMLPKRNGYDLLKELRQAGNTSSVLMLTAKGMEGDKILGLKLGADDYLAKPFGLGELLARVEAILRRRPPLEKRYSYTYNGRMIVMLGQENDVGAVVLPSPHMRRITSFKYPDRCLVYGEENVTGQSVGAYLINDCYFIYQDVSDDRHMGKACAGYLDGHAGEIPKKIQLYVNKEYGFCQ